jgi:hypothetical protein
MDSDDREPMFDRTNLSLDLNGKKVKIIEPKIPKNLPNYVDIGALVIKEDI